MKKRNTENTPASPSHDAGGRTARIIGTCDIALWGLGPRERLGRVLARAGVTALAGDGDPWPEAGSVVLVRADHAFDEAIIAALVEAPGMVLEIDGPAGPVRVAAHVDAAVGREVAALLEDGAGAALPGGLLTAPALALGADYRKALRKRESPYVMALTAETARAIEWRMFQGSYKGVTDFVTKWVWPRPAFHVTRLAARLRVTPNAVTALSLVFVVAAAWLFVEGEFLAGLAAGWVMTFLDTVDGKLARVTLTSSPLGNVFDHGIDLVHPPFWYWAWGVGVVAVPGTALAGHLALVLWIVIGGYVAGRLIEGVFIWALGMEIHVWRPLDSAFRQITARRNPNLVLLSIATACGRADLGLVAVAAWTVASIVFHLVRMAAAFGARRRDGALRSWLDAPASLG